MRIVLEARPCFRAFCEAGRLVAFGDIRVVLRLQGSMGEPGRQKQKTQVVGRVREKDFKFL